MSNALQVRFALNGKEIFGGILYQRYRGAAFTKNNFCTFTASNGFKLSSQEFPSLDSTMLYVRGSKKESDLNFCGWTYKSEIEAKAAFFDLMRAINEYNQYMALQESIDTGTIIIST